MAASFKGVYRQWLDPAFAGSFHVNTECSMKSLSQLPAPGKQASKSLSPDSSMKLEGCKLRRVSLYYVFSELEGKTTPYFDSNLRVCSLGLQCFFLAHQDFYKASLRWAPRQQDLVIVS